MENENTNKKDFTKEKIIIFAIGVLAGAVIATAALFIYVKTLSTNTATDASSSQQMQGGTPPEMSGDGNNQGGTPPEIPGGENGQNAQGETPPAKPDGEQ